jgi:membrane protein
LLSSGGTTSSRQDVNMSDSVEGDKGRGRQAQEPGQIPATGLKDVMWRIFGAFSEKRITLIAAGVTYYLLLALFPAMAVLVSLYGLISDPAALEGTLDLLVAFVPASALDLVRQQLHALGTQSTGKLNVGFVIGLLFALWSANNGLKALFEGMNIVYGEDEKRGFVRLNAVTLSATAGVAILAIIFVFALGVLPLIASYILVDDAIALLARIVRWPLVLLLFGLSVGILYRYGPSRERARFQWISWGASLATIAWGATAAGYSYYLENFADYNATYGTLGAVFGLLIWTWLSVMILLLGAVINAELEHQTSVDSTTGPAKPMGKRGAVVADTIGRPP